MKIINYKISAFLILLIGCSSPKNDFAVERENEENERNVSMDKDFMKLLESLESKELPLKLVCGLGKTFFPSEIENGELFIPKGLKIGGKINSPANFKLILLGQLGDITYPYLFSYNLQGQVIDSIYLHINTCTGDPYEEVNTWSIINKDLSITMVDTLKLFNYIENDTVFIRDLKSVIVSKKKVELKNNGTFKVISETKEEN
jgi:hypothetical protein